MTEKKLVSDCCGAEVGSYSIPTKHTDIWQTKYYCKECDEPCVLIEKEPEEEEETHVDVKCDSEGNTYFVPSKKEK